MDAQRIAVDAVVALTDCDREQVAAFILETQNGLPPGQLRPRHRKSDQTESNPIKPNPTSEAGPAASSVEVPERT